MLRDNRILFSKAGTISDLSDALSNLHSGSKVINFEPGDFLYIGSYLPFNHRYFDISVANIVAATATVEYWSGTAWVAAVDLLDATKNAAGCTLSQDGILSWQLDPNADSWSWMDTDQMASSGLEGQKIFGLYWVRITFSTTITATTAIQYVGHKFSEDEALEAEYPDLARQTIKTAWKAGKTDWAEQTILAAEYIVQELRGKRRKIVSADQIMSWQLFERANVQRTAMLIFKALGKDYEYELLEATKAYGAAMDVRNFEVDENRNGSLDPKEKESRVEWLTR